MDKKTRFFKTVLLLQFIPALLLGVLILMHFRPQKLLNIRGLHPFEFNYGQAVPLILFGICFLVSILVLFLKPQNSDEDETNVQQKNRQKNFWKFAFYSNLFFLVIIGIFLIAISKKDPLVINEPILFYSVVFSRSLLVILLSLVTASFLLTAGIYWKTNKTMGIVMLLFGFLIVCSSLVFEAIFVGMFLDKSEAYVNSKSEKGLSSDAAAEVSEDYTEESEEADSEVEKSKLISSWNSLIPDWGGLEGKNDFQEVRRLIGSSLDDHITENDHYYLVQFIDNVRGQPEGIVYEFENYKAVIYNVISPQTYQQANFDKVVNGLLLAYDDIGSENDKLIEIYQVMSVQDKNIQLLQEYFPKFEGYFSPETIEKINELKLSSADWSMKSDLIWFYSFWARRNHEGNSKQIAIILNEIKEHYNQNQSEE